MNLFIWFPQGVSEGNYFLFLGYDRTSVTGRDSADIDVQQV